MSEHERVRRRLRLAYTRMLRECEQAVRDIEWWNSNRTEHTPIDAEWFKVQAAGLRKALTAIERDEPINPAWVQTK